MGRAFLPGSVNGVARRYGFGMGNEEAVSMNPLGRIISPGLLLFLATILAIPAAAWSAGPQAAGTVGAAPVTAGIPGPLASFQRMTAISRKAGSDEILPFLARNVVIDGYQMRQGQKPRPTEYLKLIKSYLEQARELREMAGADGVIRIEGCADVAPLLKALGYRFRTPCGVNATLETEEPRRAFLTIDSGFPLVQLEENLHDGRPFEYPFAGSNAPVIFTPRDWTSDDKDFVEALLDDPQMARLYWAFSRLEEATREQLRAAPGLVVLLPHAAVLDFYGSHLYIRQGRVVVPGGRQAEAAWRNLVGVSPEAPSEFLLALVSKDNGWMAAYFDALSFTPREQQVYFADSGRLKRMYEALRGAKVTTSPARSVFRPTASIYLLTSRLMLGAGGAPHVPGSLEVWKEIFRRRSDLRIVREWARRTNSWNKPEDLLEALFALSREHHLDSPLQVYLALIEIDRRRPAGRKLSPAATRLLAERYTRFRDQFAFFSEFSDLDDSSITRFFTTADSLDAIKDRAVRANALGMFQSTVGLWQIFSRQNQIPAGQSNASWQKALQPFGAIRTADQLFDSGRAGLEELWKAAGGTGALRESDFIRMLAGPAQPSEAGQQSRQQMEEKLRSALGTQRLVSLDNLFQLAEGLTQMGQGSASAEAVLRMAASLREFEMPQPLFSRSERAEWASGLHNNPHTSLQTRTDLTKVIQQGRQPGAMDQARGILAPFLRDTMVGLNYAYYEPPGAQMIHNNPLFVRSHNFSGQMTMKGDEVWQTPRVFGRGWTAAGGAHLAGSLADLPYVLAQVEQDFIVPENTQSLIWADLVPTILTSAILPRWWNVTPSELSAVALYQQLGEQILSAAAQDPARRGAALALLSDHLLPQRLGRLEADLNQGRAEDAIAHLVPSELFSLGSQMFTAAHAQDPARAAALGPAAAELARLAQSAPGEISLERISRDFGAPHPMLAQTYARELLATKPLPTFLGYSSRLLAESWESGNLFWARLAVEKNYPPSRLNQLIPELTHRMVEKIFATHLEDWPAVQRAMRETAVEFREGKLGAPPEKTASAAPGASPGLVNSSGTGGGF